MEEIMDMFDSTDELMEEIMDTFKSTDEIMDTFES